MHARRLRVRRLGRLEYGEAYRIQKETELAVRERREPDTLLLVEHPHVLTVGRRATPELILAGPDALAARGVSVYETNRGGKMTYHGLGQLVGYPVINLSPDREDVHKYVRDLEEVLMRTMLDFRIPAFRVEGADGRPHSARQDRRHRHPHRALGHDARLRLKRQHRPRATSSSSSPARASPSLR